MFVFSPLARLFVTERHRQRAGVVGFSVPALSEAFVGDINSDPLLVTNMRGSFVRTRVSREGYARYGFCECSLDLEGDLMLALYQGLRTASENEGWGNRVSSIEEAVELQQKTGLVPKTLVVSDGVEVKFDGLVVRSPLPEGAALLATDQQHTGYYTRVGDHVGILAHNVNRTFVVVG